MELCLYRGKCVSGTIFNIRRIMVDLNDIALFTAGIKHLTKTFLYGHAHTYLYPLHRHTHTCSCVCRPSRKHTITRVSIRLCSALGERQIL